MKLNIPIPNLRYQDYDNFLLIAGPCVIEDDWDLMVSIAHYLKFEISDEYLIPFVFKASYRKANRSRYDSFQGVGDEKALKMIQDIGACYQIPTLTDIHSAGDAWLAAQYVDVLQIPAFLCRQTDILQAAAETGKWINVKKGQFLHGYSMDHVVEKIRHFGNDKILLTERGSMFGYEDLVVDYRNVPIMQKTGCPVVVDITHSVQKPSYIEGVTQGSPEFIETLGRCAIAAGADGIFMEVHPQPNKSPSDATSILAMYRVDNIISRLVKLRKVVKSWTK